MNRERVNACDHEWTSYSDNGKCDTPYCRWIESHCRKCRVYKVTCGCGCNDGLSGEPVKRETARYAAREKAVSLSA